MHKRLPCRYPRQSEWPLLAALVLGVPILIWLLETGSALTLENESIVALEGQDLQEFIPGNVQPVSCHRIVTASQRVTNATDANRHRLFLRHTEDNPRFWISLHTKGYDKVRWAVMERGRYYEQVESDCFREILANSTKPRVIDVGGNIGWYTLLSASLGAKVDTFEPNPRNYLRTCESLCVNRWIDGSCPNIGDLATSWATKTGRVRIFPVGIGSEPSTALFESGLESRNNPGAGGIVTSQTIPKSSRAKYTEIQIVTLDIMAQNLGWYKEDIDIMKIDVEGYEIHVMRGAKKLLRANRIKNVFMEGDVSGPAKKKRFREVIRIFADAGYIVFKVGGYSGPSRREVPPMDSNIEETLTDLCAGGAGPKRKKCNLWWKLPNV